MRIRKAEMNVQVEAKLLCPQGNNESNFMRPSSFAFL